jgi:hypothetical protein
MAIRRCPYCKAIIDEQDKYCNNCGTQLLFPEDEFVEEDIPGDKIVEEPETEEEREAEELEETSFTEEEGEEETEQQEEAEKEEHGEEEEREEEEEIKGIPDKLEELEEERPEEKETEEEEREEGLQLEAEEGEDTVEELEEEAEIEELAEKIKTGDLESKLAQADDYQKKYKVSIEEDELVFRTKDLDNLTGAVEEGKEKLEEFLSSFQKEKAKSVTPHEVPALFQEGEETGAAMKEALPPWARGLKEEPPQPAGPEKSKETAAEMETGPEATPTRPEWTTDSGIGIPEKVTPSALPFGAGSVPATAAEQEEAAEGDEEFGRALRQRAGLSLRLKSKLVDFVFITALWLITLWFTAQVIGVSFLRLIVGSPVPVLAFYLILLLLYFFLFLYFLGETLGDHYFSEED